MSHHYCMTPNEIRAGLSFILSGNPPSAVQHPVLCQQPKAGEFPKCLTKTYKVGTQMDVEDQYNVMVFDATGKLPIKGAQFLTYYAFNSPEILKEGQCVFYPPKSKGPDPVARSGPKTTCYSSYNEGDDVYTYTIKH